ncbi:hypothetical protein ABH926_008431 [Catenulispora sp. GP43]|uniref:hypothetical protein n=1 Tax=Catenulispora sp. GP43 TaxID=3156263 RepID=UPI003513D2EC
MAVTSQHIRLTSGVDALVLPGSPAAARPRLRLDSPTVVVESPSAGTGSVDARSVGSFDWLMEDDEYWAFDTADGMLLSLRLTVPEVNRESEPDRSVWDAAEAATGTLRLSVLKNFGRAPAVERWCDPTGSELFGFYTAEADGFVGGASRSRLVVAEGTYLLAADSILTGWSIEDPARFICGDAVPASVYGTKPDIRLPALLVEFFRLVTVENVDRLEDGDQDLKRGLEELADRLQAVGDGGESRALEILNKVRQVLEDFA